MKATTMKRIALALTALTALTTLRAIETKAAATFGDDITFLRRHTETVVLSDKSGQAQVAVVPAWQGRVMTSTARGAKGASFGWVNRELIASGQVQPHINVFGGEDRFWLGPEGGQFSIFFAQGVPFDLEHWFTPAVIDTEPFEVVSQSADRVHCRRHLQLTNYSGTRFDLEVNREVRLVNAADALAKLGLKLPSGVKSVGFESVNSVKNTGRQPWKKETGLLSIWILGMLKASPETTVVIPFEKGPESERGTIVNDTFRQSAFRPADGAGRHAFLPRRRELPEQDWRAAAPRQAHAGQLRRRRPHPHSGAIHAGARDYRLRQLALEAAR